MEQRQLSYELLKGGHVHFLDPRFNMMLGTEQIVYYPFLLPEPGTPVKKTLLDLERVQRKIWKLSGDPLQKFRIDAVNTVYQSSFFLHFGGIIDAPSQSKGSFVVEELVPAKAKLFPLVTTRTRYPLRTGVRYLCAFEAS